MDSELAKKYCSDMSMELARVHTAERVVAATVFHGNSTGKINNELISSNNIFLLRVRFGNSRWLGQRLQSL